MNTTYPVRIGVQIRPQHGTYRDIRKAAVTAEELGVDVIFNWDHFFPLSGDPDGTNFECWTMLASFAEVTEQVEIGALVTCYSYRNGHLLADMARTVDHISEGRLILGLGAGWYDRDYHEYEYPFGTFGTRLRDFEAGLYRINRRLGLLNPPPVRDIPVLIGGMGEKHTLRLAGKYADIWHGFGNAETLIRKNRILDEWCRVAGRDPSEVERSIAAELPLSGSSREAAESVEQADGLVEAGATLITLAVDGPDYDFTTVQEWLNWRDSTR
ncbi:MAG: LLM class F420-dependent oxidoreductase [Acidimicrobiia bacterium]|nr:LLM class F420-dependent oxidoreductase [bacterium]MXX65068.1 LLM class F420-dependent oxidoreductase [Acidimicrobiia bacterium]MCY3652323.1 LLM class F420-dependent oxidoreductase [bacterium]MDE0643133.1 LLM class F420-dependent oxidoreductase [bacterium]MXZ07500.1 LLM class F420-dependent oxidoreductase [Acidimicrobiia bacterium]